MEIDGIIGSNILRQCNWTLDQEQMTLTFTDEKADYDKEIDVDVTSAVELSSEQQAEISASLEKRLARKVKLNCNVDPALVAGVLIKAGDIVIDGSVRSKLDRLADALQA